jgi:hypothetical protein
MSLCSACPVKIVHGEWTWMPEVVREWAAPLIEMCQPDGLHIMDGTEEEDRVVGGAGVIVVVFFNSP